MLLMSEVKTDDNLFGPHEIAFPLNRPSQLIVQVMK